MNEMNVLMAKRLKEIRNHADLTQSQMAEKIGVALRSYQKYEAGERFPKASIIDNICTVFSISKNKLFLTDEIAEEKNESASSWQDALSLLTKISQLNERNISLLERTIDQMIMGQEAASSRALKKDA